MKKKIRKPLSMPQWYWLDTDGCWFCNNRSNCNRCPIIKKYRKEFFLKKYKGFYSDNDRKKGYNAKEIY